MVKYSLAVASTHINKVLVYVSIYTRGGTSHFACYTVFNFQVLAVGGEKRQGIVIVPARWRASARSFHTPAMSLVTAGNTHAPQPPLKFVSLALLKASRYMVWCTWYVTCLLLFILLFIDLFFVREIPFSLCCL